MHLARGICSGSGRFREYAIVMGSDGVVRIVLCVVLAVVGVTAVGAYGLAVALAPLFGLTWVYARRGLRTDPGPEATWAEVTPNLGWLLLGSVFAASLLNAGPIAMTLLADRRRECAGHAVRLRRPARPHPAVHVPGRAGRAAAPVLSRLAAVGELVEFRAGLRRLLMIVVAVGVVGTLGAFILGPCVLEVVFGADD